MADTKRTCRSNLSFITAISFLAAALQNFQSPLQTNQIVPSNEMEKNKESEGIP